VRRKKEKKPSCNPNSNDTRQTPNPFIPIPTNRTLFISCLHPLAVLAVIGSEVVGGEEHAGHPDAAADAQSLGLYPRAGNGVRGKKVAGGHLDGEGVAVHVSYQLIHR